MTTSGQPQLTQMPSASVSTANTAMPAVPRLSFAITDAAAEPRAAVPTLRFTLAIECLPPAATVRSLLLTSQIRIAVARRNYDAEEQQRLAELFGSPDRWGETLKSMYWTHATSVVPEFGQRTSYALLVPCTYDFDVVTAKYFSGVKHGEIPLDFLFSGSVFYDDSNGRLQTARLSWESEARFRLSVSVWKDMIQHYFPNSAWLRVRRDVFDRLYAVQSEQSLQSWDATIESLLPAPKTSGAG